MEIPEFLYQKDSYLKILVMTCVYPGVEDYIDDFLDSLVRQTSSSFELLIVNDGLSELSNYIQAYQSLDIHILDVRVSMGQNRVLGIQACIELGAEAIVFADSDDVLSDNRIQVSAKLIQNKGTHAVINDVHCCDASLRILQQYYFSNRLSDGQIIEFDMIKHANVCGLSNSMVMTEAINTIDLAPVDLFDWSFFTRLSYKGANIVFTNQATTYYRQHGSNQVGIGHDLSEDGVLRAVGAKALHYQSLIRLDSQFERLADYFGNLVMEMKAEERGREYVNRCLNNAPEYPFWWEEAQIFGDKR